MALLVDVRGARSAIGREPEAGLAHRLDRLIDDLRTATDELRELARGVRPPILADAGIGPALRALGQRSSIPVALDVDLDVRLDPGVESAAYFVAAEALTNVARHSGATEARVSAYLDDGGHRLRLAIADNGHGGAVEAVGSGIRGLRDRVEALGGILSLTSQLGVGTTLTVELPCGS